MAVKKAKATRKTGRASSTAKASAKARSTKTTKKASTRSRSATTRKSRTPLRHKRVLGLRLHHAAGLAAVVVGVIWGAFALASLPSGKSSAATCTVSPILVNSCRPWLGEATGGYSMAPADKGGQVLFSEQRLNNPTVLTNANQAASTSLNKKYDFIHYYQSGSGTNFSPTEISYLDRPNTYLYVNYKPTDSWAAGGGSNAQVNANIDALADTFNQHRDKKIILAIYHEPEDNVSPGTINCPRLKGNSGSPAQYVQMWHNVRARFDAKGVTNAVWSMNYMGFAGWNCVQNALWPGNNYVDWVMWDPYSKGGNFANSVNSFYSWLTSNSNAAHDYTSKPWGLGEYGSNGLPANVYNYYSGAATAIGSNWNQDQFPRLKLFNVFDTSTNGGSNGGLRVGYNDLGKVDVNEQAAYDKMATSILNFSGSSSSPVPPPPPSPSKDKIPPTASISLPHNNVRIKGKFNVIATAHDNVKVKAVTLRVDNQWVSTSGSSPFSLPLDSTKFINGTHTIVVRAWDTSNNMGESKSITLNFQNGHLAPKTSSATSTPPTKVISVNTVATQSAPVKTTGNLVLVNPVIAGDSVQVSVDGKSQSSNNFDTTNLTNGIHNVKITETGRTIATQLVALHVQNPPLLATINNFRANTATYTALVLILTAVVVAWLGRTYVFGLTSRRERAATSSQRSYKKKR